MKPDFIPELDERLTPEEQEQVSRLTPAQTEQIIEQGEVGLSLPFPATGPDKRGVRCAYQSFSPSRILKELHDAFRELIHVTRFEELDCGVAEQILQDLES